MGTVQDASTLNGVTINSTYIYTVNSSSVSSSGINGVNTYSGQVATSGAAGLSGTITDTSSGGNGSFQLTSASGTVSNYLVLGSSSDSQNLVIQSYMPSTGQTGSYYLISNSGMQPTGSVSFNSNNGYLNPTCFLAGTLIMTDKGETAVEFLNIGDLVKTADGNYSPIRWIGSRSYDCRTYIKPIDVLPIRIAADAIAPGIPHQDTFLSEGHAIVLTHADSVFVPVHALTNGSTIRQVDADHVRYYHLELDDHQAVIANGLQAETYLDCGNRQAYSDYRVEDDFATQTDGKSVAPRYPRHDGDAVAERLRDRLSARAYHLQDDDSDVAYAA